MGNVLRPFGSKDRQAAAERRESDAARQMQDISRALFAQTEGLRAGGIGTLEQVLAGGRPENMRVFAPEREAVEAQFRRARENILSSTPMRGGQLNRSLADIEMGRASMLGGLEADVRRSALAQALGVGFGVPPISIAGLGGAGQIFGAAANRSFQETQALNSTLMSIAGMAAGCWIAMRLYGAGEHMQLARLWIFELWEGRLADAVRWAYRRWGHRVSTWWGVWLLRPFFDRAVRNARLALEAI